MYTLVDGVERNRENPKTFIIPTLLDKMAVSEGEYVKLCFMEGEYGERMWVKVTSITGDSFKGILENYPRDLDSVTWGDEVEFQSRHIIGVTE